MSTPGATLREMIEKAIQDEKVTTTEYNLIMKQAHADCIIDNEEKALLSAFQTMIADKTVKRVPD